MKLDTYRVRVGYLNRWYQESLEKLRRIETIQLMMRAMGQFQTEMGTFEGPSRGLSQWIDVNTPRLDDE